jgi:RNA polymerase sigma-70 factor (ECF subfamily)
MEYQEIIPHLFRTEFRKMAAVLCKHFGLDHMEVAEDIASETFLLAMETWPFKGVPENPVAWLYTVAKNKARNLIRRNHIFSAKIAGALRNVSQENRESEIDFSESNITDSQLQMLFALCHPSIPIEAQIGLSLRILCGFGIDEIANAFLTNKETINKRLYRAKEKLRIEQVPVRLPSENEIEDRLEAVLRTLYLLFSEGYYSETHNVIVQEELCLEAIRLTFLLVENEKTNLPVVNALLSLMCFHSSRFPARKKGDEPVLYQDQDETLWNQELIHRGIYFLNQASKGNKISKYHLEASIAYWHTIKTDTKEKWENILQLYNHLLVVEYSPVAALNRTFALSKARGNQAAIIEAEKLQLTNNHYYYTLLGELYKDIDKDKAKANLQQAYVLAKTQTDKRTILQKMNKL